MPSYNFIDFHAHPAAELRRLRNRLQSAGAVASVLYPIDVDPTLSLTLSGLFRLARDLGMVVMRSQSLGRFMTWLVSGLST
jgi:hypothetical protein